MRFLLRQTEQQTRTSRIEATEDRLEAVRTHGCQLLSAADEAIERALSGSNSESFLRAGRQQGGE